MTLLQNQALDAPLNVLHDQGTPNTLGRMIPPAPAGRLRLPVGMVVVVAVTIGVVLAILVGRLA